MGRAGVGEQQKTMGQRITKGIFFAASAAVIVYLAVQSFAIFHHPYKTETAIAYKMADSVQLTGVALFDAQDVPGGGNLGYLVSDGERVTGGTVIAEYYTDSNQALLRERLDQISRSIELLTKSQNSSGNELSVLTSQTEQALYNLLGHLDNAQYSGMAEAQETFLLAQNRLQISTGQADNFDAVITGMQAERDAIREQLGTLETIEAQTNGYFVCAELAPQIQPDAQALEEADPPALQAMLEQGFPKYEGQRVGRIVSGFSWLFYAACPLDTAARFEEGSSVSISVPGKQSEPLSALVKEVLMDEETGLAKVVLECRTINAAVLRLGVETVRVDLKTYEGIRIDRKALHIVDGQRGVYVKYGNLQRFLKITTLYENENYILVPADGAVGSNNEVRLYDEIIVEGTNLRDGRLI